MFNDSIFNNSIFNDSIFNDSIILCLMFLYLMIQIKLSHYNIMLYYEKALFSTILTLSF